MTIDQALDRVRFAYPQIYYACHTRHERRRSGPSGVSRRDSEILVHLHPTSPTTLAELARHMDLAKTTLSEALSTLERLGYVAKTGGVRPGRRDIGIVLTARGTEAVRASSVLDAGRLHAALSRLTPRQRSDVIRALTLLASASRGIALRKDR